MPFKNVTLHILRLKRALKHKQEKNGREREQENS